MAFLSAMDFSTSHLVLGENGAPAHETTGDARVDLFFALVRNLPEERLRCLVADCLADSNVSPAEAAADLVVMAFQTRDCRGGKGERALFTQLFLEVHARFPVTAIALLPLVPAFGYYRDWFVIAHAAAERAGGGANATCAIADAVVALAAAQLKADAQALDAAATAGRRPEGVSLLAKWAPREGNSTFGGLTRRLATACFPTSDRAKADYRKLLAKINRHLGTVEVHMCGAAWGEIDPSSVPSLALLKARKALLNEALKGPPPTPSQSETGNRRPGDEGRVACRRKLRASLLESGAKKLNGKQLYPHEIVRLCFGPGNGGRRGGASELELEVLNAQWQAMREGTAGAMAAAAAVKATTASASAGAADAGADATGAGGGDAKDSSIVNLGKLVPLVDVSGSMSGTPMEVAVALGILTSELNDPAFQHRMLTFSATPAWVRFEANAPIATKVQTALQSEWGMSTDFAAALELILQVAIAANLQPHEIPDLIVFSDMQFDDANQPRGGGSGRSGSSGGGSWATHHARLVQRFAAAGMASPCGAAWPCPTVTFWNLRGDTVGFPAAANTPGVNLVSGFSPQLLKLLLAGEPLDAGGSEAEADEPDAADGATAASQPLTKKAKKNPLDLVRRALDDAQYDAVRAVLHASTEGALAGYAFASPTATTAAAAVKGTAKGATEGAAVADGEEATDSLRMVGLRMEGDEREEVDVP